MKRSDTLGRNCHPQLRPAQPAGRLHSMALTPEEAQEFERMKQDIAALSSAVAILAKRATTEDEQADELPGERTTGLTSVRGSRRVH